MRLFWSAVPDQVSDLALVRGSDDGSVHSPNSLKLVFLIVFLIVFLVLVPVLVLVLERQLKQRLFTGEHLGFS